MSAKSLKSKKRTPGVGSTPAAGCPLTGKRRRNPILSGWNRKKNRALGGAWAREQGVRTAGPRKTGAIGPTEGGAGDRKPAIREVLQRFLAGKGTTELATALVVRAGNVALLCSNWRLSGVGSDGEPRERADVGTEVVRRRDDGTWRYLIDLPFRTG